MRKLAVLFAACVVLVALGGCLGPCLPPIASFMACPDGSSNNLSLQFSSTSQGSDGHGLVFFRWDFGDGTKVDDYYGWVTHRYASAGAYTVSLTVTDDRGVKASHEQSVVAAPVVELGDVIFTSGYPSRAVGEIANVSSLFLYYASIKVKFYDREGVRVGETTIDVQSIDPGERVRFAAEAPLDVGPISAASAFIQSFAPECSGGPIPVPVYGDK
jgi:PKD repeat protein